MIVRAAVLVSLILAGCASTDTLASKPPVLSVQSDRPADDLQQCILLIFASGGFARTTREGDRRFITLGREKQATALITISGEHPALVEVQQGGVFPHIWRQRVRECAANRAPDAARG